MKKLENKVALVTAATRGIGLASAILLAEHGATVYIGSVTLEEGKAVCDEYAKKGINLKYVLFDAYALETYKDMVNTIIHNEGRLDILVNNFGTGRPEKDFDLLNSDEDTFFELMESNLGSVYRVTKLALPHMIKQQSGSIVNISSIGGSVPDISRIGYGVSKASINNITQQIALQYAKDGVRCNAILPGLTATKAAMDSMSEDFRKSFLAHVPLKRIGTPEDMAKAVLFFASDDSSYVTGNIMEVSGGYSLGTPQYAEYIGKHAIK